MRIPSDSLQIVLRLYDNLVSGVCEDLLGLRQFASKTGVLPLAPDMSGFLGINRQGEVVAVAYDNLDAPHLVEEERVRNMVLFRGSKLYSELGFLAPTEPDDARQCPHCLGTGMVPNVPAEIADKIV